MEIFVKYAKQELIKAQKIGTVFAGGGDTLWVKISEDNCMELGTGNLIPFTNRCQAYIITHIGARA